VRRRWLLGFGVVSLALLGWFFWSSEESSRPEEAALAVDSFRKERAHRLERLAAEPLSSARGTLSIRGRVVGPGGPASGVLVSALAESPPEWLARLAEQYPPHNPNKSNNPPCDDSSRMARFLEEVEVRRSEDVPRARAFTDAQGVFQLDGLEAGSFLLWAESPEEELALRPDVPAGSGDIELRVGAGRFVSGTVRGVDGARLADARILLLVRGAGHLVETSTAADGRFRVGPLPWGGESLLIVAKEGWSPLRLGLERLPPGMVFSLTPSREISGRVLDEKGPVAGVPVEARSWKQVHLSRTDERGAFRFDSLCARPYELTAIQGDRYARQRLAEGQDGAELFLSGSTLQLSGRVTDESGGLLPDVEVSMSRKLGEALVRRTDSRGSFLFEALVPDDYSIRFQAARHVPLEMPMRFLEVSQELSVSLTGAHRVEGVVVDEQGRAVEGARLSLLDSERPRQPITSGVRGEFLLEVERSLAPRIEVRHPDFIALETSLPAAAREVRLVLSRGASLEVEVVDEMDRPVAQAHVALGRSKDKRTATAGEDGRVVVGGLASGSWLVMALPLEGGRRYAQGEVALSGQETRKVRLQLQGRWTLSGRVVDGEGKSLEGVRLLARPTRFPHVHATSALIGEVLREGSEGVSGPEGAFTLPNLAREPWSLQVQSHEYVFDTEASRGVAAQSRNTHVTVSPDQPNVLLVLRATERVQGRVVDEAGSPVTSFRLDEQPLHHPEGRFSLALPTWRQVLKVDAPGFLPMTLTARRLQAHDLGDVVLKAAATLRGQVVDARTLAPLSGAEVSVHLQPYPGQPRGTRVSTSTLPDGRFTLEGSSSSGATLHVSHPAYLSATKKLAEGQREVRVELNQGATLEGRVEAAGKRLPSGEIRLRLDSGTEVSTVGVWDGHYTMRNVAPGRYVLQALGPSQDGSAPLFPLRPVSLSEGEHVTVDFTGQPASASVEVLVAERGIEVHLVPGDVPLIGPRQGLYGRLAEGFMGMLVREGVRRFVRLPAGHYTLIAVSRDELGTEVHREELEVPAEGEISFTLSPQWSLFEEEPVR